jgi:predicted nucleic acid-binding Zn ribbon protein
MPLYLYEVVTGDGSPGEQFEIFQSMSEPPLTHHPETGVPIRRVLCAPAIGGKWSDAAMKRSVGNDKKLEQLGFTKYVKAGDGIYEKRAGKGPQILSADSIGS